MANLPFTRGKKVLADYNWAGDAVAIGILLVQNDYVFSREHNTIADVIAAGTEASGTGYLRKSIPFSSRATNEDDPGGAANLRVSDGTVTWTSLSAGLDLRVVLFFIDGADINDPLNQLLGYIDSGTNIPINTSGIDVGLNFSTDGLVKNV